MLLGIEELMACGVGFYWTGYVLRGRLYLDKNALELICDSNKWTRGAYARDKDDVVVELRDASATKYCVRGAMMLVGCSIGDYTRAELMAIEMYDHSLISVNDRIGHKAVIQVLESCV